jgi:transposase InsO family protein
MEEMSKHGQIGRASMLASMDRKTGRKYVKSGRLPSQMNEERTWRTREDPFSADWSEIVEKLRDCPEFEAKTLFEWLLKEKVGAYQEGQLRTFQRHVKQWRCTEGPDQEVFFDQQHRPGEAMQTDFTGGSKLSITIGGEAFAHLLCHVVLPYSNWESVTVCRSESFMAVKLGVQDAIFRLGFVPLYHQSDNLSAATHNLQGQEKRPFNEDYERFISYYGMTPRTIGIGKPNQNGDVESLNNALKRRLEQHLKLRGSRDFESVEAYEAWIQGVVSEANDTRTERIAEELKTMRKVSESRLSDYVEEEIRVNRGSLIRVKENSYSVPSRLRGEKVRVRIHEDHLEVYYGGIRQLETPRLLGRSGYHVNYRHVIWSLVQKPGAFARYRYREAFFPSLIFRQSYDALCAAYGSGAKADSQYLRILHQAAAVSETDVEAALELMLSEKIVPDSDRVKVLVQPLEAELPMMAPFKADLGEYDSLLPACAEEVSR